MTDTIVEVTHVRDPDGFCGLTVFVNGVPVSFTEESVDAGAGCLRSDWDEHTDFVRTNEKYTAEFRAHVVDSRQDAPGGKYIEED